MSFETALASCWDICKYNCTNSGKYFNPLEGYNFPQFYPAPYESYTDFSNNPEYPYTEKPRRRDYAIEKGIVERDDKLVSSFLGWIFTIPEMLVWATVAVGMTLLSVLAFLVLVVALLAAPIFLRFNEDGIFYYQYPKFLRGMLHLFSNSAGFTLSSLLRVPYHLMKALVRIPAGVVVAVQEIVSPSPAPILQPMPEPPLVANTDQLNQRVYSPIFVQERPGVESSEEDNSEERRHNSDEDGDMENQGYDQEDYFARNRSYMNEQFSFIYQMLIESAIEALYSQLLSQYPFMEQDLLLAQATIAVMQRFSQGVRLLASQTQGNSPNDDIQTAIDISFNERPPSSTSDPIQRREPKTNWCEDQLDKLGFINRPARYTCVISGALMNPPFLVGDGNLYNEDSIETYFGSSVVRKSPINREMPFTHKSGIALETVKNEIVSFMIAVRANYHVDKIQGKEEKNSGTKAVLKVAEDIEKKANTLHEEINEYVKKRHTTDRLILAKEMINDKAMISTTVIAKAWGYIKVLTGASDDPHFLTMSPTNAIAHFFMIIKEKDASFDNLIINALREAMLEEQKVSKEYEATWISQPGRGIAALGDELSTRLNQYLPDEKPQNLDGVVEKIQKDKNISDKALQYALLLIKDPEKAVNFDQFEPEKKERLTTINAFLEAFYAPENVLLKPVFLMTLKEIVLKEGMAFKQSSNSSNTVCFGSVLQQSASQESENCDLNVVKEVSLEKGI